MRVLLLLLLFNFVYAVIPVIDEHVLSEDRTTMVAYITQLQSFLIKLTKVRSSIRQNKLLKDIIALEGSIRSVCSIHCSSTQRAIINQYLNKMDSLMTSNFNTIFDGHMGVIDNIEDIANFIISSSSNSKNASLALQQSTELTLVNIQRSLLNISQSLLAHIQQEHTYLEVERQKTADIYYGFSRSGL